jgi:hypothetical protein
MIEIHYYIIQKGIKKRRLRVETTQGKESAKVKFEKWFKKHFKNSRLEIIDIYEK